MLLEVEQGRILLMEWQHAEDEGIFFPLRRLVVRRGRRGPAPSPGWFRYLFLR
jgi:hypothetical protein